MSVPHLTTADYEQKVGDYKNVDKWSFKGERPCLVDFILPGVSIAKT